jgi:hypothetical protein
MHPVVRRNTNNRGAAGGGETIVSNTDDDGGGNSDKHRQQRPPTPQPAQSAKTKTAEGRPILKRRTQQRIHAFERQRIQDLRLMHAHGTAALSVSLRTLCGTATCVVAVLLLALVVGIVVVGDRSQPMPAEPATRTKRGNRIVSRLFPFWRSMFVSQERLPGRTIVTVYPQELHIQKALPRFFLNYGECCAICSAACRPLLMEEGTNRKNL